MRKMKKNRLVIGTTQFRFWGDFSGTVEVTDCRNPHMSELPTVSVSAASLLGFAAESIRRMEGQRLAATPAPLLLYGEGVGQLPAVGEVCEDERHGEQE